MEINMKELLGNKEKKNFFSSNGFSEIKVTKDGKAEIIKIPIFSVSPDHAVIKEYIKNNPAPKPPVIRAMINELGETIKDKADLNTGKYKYGQILDYSNETYIKAFEEWNQNIVLLQMMIIFDVFDKYGTENIKQFEKDLQEMGLTGNQFEKLRDDIKNLDYMPTEK